MTLTPRFRLLVRGLAPAALLLLLVTPRNMTAQTANQDHIVTSQALDQQLATSSATRQQNIETLQKLMETPAARKAMQDAKVDPEQVKNAIPTLSNDELANLSARAHRAQHDFAAGFIGPGLFTILILVVILIIIVIVVH